MNCDVLVSESAVIRSECLGVAKRATPVGAAAPSNPSLQPFIGLKHSQIIGVMVVFGVSAARLPGRRQITRAFAENGTQQVRVRFSVKQRVKYGQHVAIVGSNPALGAWDPTKSVSLEWGDGDRWSGAVEIPAAGEVELKFVVVDGERVQWQPGDNVKVPCTAPEVVVEAEGLDGGDVKIFKTNGALKATETAEKKTEAVKDVKAVKDIKTAVASSNGAVAPATAPAPAAAAAPVKLDKLTVVQLKEKAKTLGLSTTGKKADLVARIQAALE